VGPMHCFGVEKLHGAVRAYSEHCTHVSWQHFKLSTNLYRYPSQRNEQTTLFQSLWALFRSACRESQIMEMQSMCDLGFITSKKGAHGKHCRVGNVEVAQRS
jgi:hypothetical protein